MTDDDGLEVGAGDMIGFSFGIPPRGVECCVVEREGVLWAIVQNRSVKPRKCRLRTLRRYIGQFYKIAPTPTTTGEEKNG